MAEEKYEVLEATAETLRERVAELEVEAAVVAERSGGLEPGGGGATPAAADALAHAQLVKQNERLKEALVRLRDLTADNEQESRRRIHDLEKELDLTSELQSPFGACTAPADCAQPRTTRWRPGSTKPNRWRKSSVCSSTTRSGPRTCSSS